MSQNNDDKPHSYTESAYKEFQPLSKEQFNSQQNQNRDNAIVGFLKTGLDKIDQSGLVLSNDDKARLLNKRIENLSKPSAYKEGDIWHSWEEGAILGKEVDVMLYDGSVLNNCIPQADSDFYYKPFDRFLDIASVKRWKYSFENLYD